MRSLAPIFMVAFAASALSGRGGVAAEAGLFAQVREGTAVDESFDISMEVELKPGAARSRVQVVFNHKSPRECLVFDMDSGAATLRRIGGGRSKVLARREGVAAARGGRERVIVRRRPGKVTVVIGSRVALSAKEDSLKGGSLGIGTKSGAKVFGVKYQKVGLPRFSDDFMRPEGEADPWRRLSGVWKQSGTTFRHLHGGAFRMVGTSTGDGVAVAGEGFWSDYVARLAVRPISGAAGLGFHCHETSSRYEILIVTPPEGRGGGTIVLRRIVAGRAEVIEGAAASVKAGEWYALGVIVTGTRLRAYVDGVMVFDVKDERLVGGPIGMVVSGRRGSPGTAQFDDVSVSPVPDDMDRLSAADIHRLLKGADDIAVPDYYAREPDIHPWARSDVLWRRTADGVLWHRARVFGEGRVAVRSKGKGLSSGEIALTLHGDGNKANSGYHLVVSREEGKAGLDAKIHKGGDLVAETRLDVAADAPTRSIELSLAGGRLVARVDAARAFDMKETKPVPSGYAAAVCRGRRLLPGSVELRAPGFEETTFTAAPTGWLAGCGEWRSRSRWSCDPEHSWYGCEDGVSVLWSKRAMPGDGMIEFYGAARMADRREPFYDSPVNIGCAIAADGRNPATGYAIVFGATDMDTVLLRDGVVVARSSKMADPATRSSYRSIIDVNHRAWWRIRIERRGDLVVGSVGDGIRLEYRDPKPLKGGRACIFTAGANGLMVARARTSSATVGMVSPVGEGALGPGFRPGGGPSAVISSLRFKGIGGAEGADVIHVSHPIGDQAVIVNRNPGGSFAAELATGGVDLSKTPVLRLGLIRSKTARVDAFAGVGGKLYRIRLWGAEDDGPALPLADLSAEYRGVVDAEVSVNLTEALSGYVDDVNVAKLDRVVIGWLGNDPLLDAGLTGNRAGDTVIVTAVSFLPGGVKVAVRAKPADEAAGVHFADDLEAGAGPWRPFGGSQAAQAERVPGGPGGSRWCLRLRSPNVGSALGLEWPIEAIDLARPAVLSFDYMMNGAPHVGLYAFAGGRWYSISFADPTEGRPSIGSVGKVKRDGKWHGARVDLSAAARRKGIAAPVERIIFCDLGENGNVTGAKWYLDNVRLMATPAVQNARVAPAGLPGAPYVSCIRGDAVTAMSFEPGEPGGTIRPGAPAPSSRRGTLATVERKGAAAGSGCLAIMRRGETDYFSSYLMRNPFTASRYPVIEFDLKLTGGARSSLTFPFQGRLLRVGLAGNMWGGAYIGTARGVAIDGKWHHVKIDLARMLRRRGLDVETAIDYIATAAAGQCPTEAVIHVDNFTIHSGRSSEANLIWRAPDGSAPVAAWSYAMDREPLAVPDEKAEPPGTEKLYDKLTPGRWYFHVRGRGPDGQWGAPAHMAIDILPANDGEGGVE